MTIRSRSPFTLVAVAASLFALLLPTHLHGQASRACQVPLRWTVGEVDPRFGLSAEEAADAIRQAGMLWEEAMGRPLLFQEASDGMAVRFLWDERQALVMERNERLAEIEEEAGAVEAATAELEALREELDRRRALHEERQFDFRDRLARFSETVEYWNRAGGAPPDEFRRLQAVEAEIEVLRAEVNDEAEAINGLVARVNADAERVNRRIGMLNQARAILDQELPVSGPVPSAEYREARGALGGLLGGTVRSLEVYRFEDRDQLLRIVAHELGHALGLPNSGVAGSLMSSDAPWDAPEGRPRAHSMDAELLRTTCPNL